MIRLRRYNNENTSMSELEATLANLKISNPSTPSNIATPIRKPLGISNNNNTTPNMESPLRNSDSPRRSNNPSTRVIENLHQQIDELKDENLKLKSNNEEFKKTNEIVKKRRDQLMEQLSNSKHEIDTVNSLLQRKQRRVNDLEEQLNDASSSTDSIKFELERLQRNYNELKTEKSSKDSEFARLEIAYDTLVTTHKQYRDKYTEEIDQLKERVKTHIEEKSSQITKNISLINKSDATIFRSIKSITLRSKELEEKYNAKDELVSNQLNNLYHDAGKHDTEVNGLITISKQLFDEIADKFQLDKTELLEKYLNQDDTRTNPFEETQPVEEIKQPVDSSAETTGPKLTIKKRNEKHSLSDSTRTLSVEERITSLGKELNSSIPVKDRTTPVEPIIQRSRSIKRNNTVNSRRSSKIFDDKPNLTSSSSSRTSSNNEPKRNSKNFDSTLSSNPDVFTRLCEGSANPPINPSSSSTSQPFKNHSRKPSLQVITTDVEAQSGDDSLKPKKRRRRRRRGGRKHNGMHIKEDGESDDESGNESNQE